MSPLRISTMCDHPPPATKAARRREMRAWLQRAGVLGVDTDLGVEERAVFWLMHLDPARCESCLVVQRDTPQWRPGWYSPALQRVVRLCNTCGLRCANARQCPLCMQSFRVRDVQLDPAQWRACSECGRFSHELCVQRLDRPLPALAQVLAADGERLPYVCAHCRHENGAFETGGSPKSP